MSTQVIQFEEQKLDTPSKRMKALSGALEDSVKAVALAARIFKLMVDHGDDTSSLPVSIKKWLAKVADKTVLPEVFVQLNGVLRERVSRLPVAQQKSVLAGKKFDVVLLRGSKSRVLKMDARDMTAKQVRQVMDDVGSIRSKSEQTDYLNRLASLGHADQAAFKAPEAVVDTQRKGVVVAGKFFSAKTIRSWLKKMS